jgi:hypothetical protein
MPQNFVSVGDKTHLNDVSKLLARQVLGIDLPKFSGDVKRLCNTPCSKLRSPTLEMVDDTPSRSPFGRLHKN